MNDEYEEMVRDDEHSMITLLRKTDPVDVENRDRSSLYDELLEVIESVSEVRETRPVEITKITKKKQYT